MIRRYRSIRRVANSIGLAAILLGLGASPAIAGPSFAVQLTRDEAVVSHSDERVDYTVKVTNTAAGGQTPKVGETMTCTPGTWVQNPTFTYQWIRNGVALESAEDKANGSQTQSYKLQAADAGEAVQCRVTGTNAVGKSVQASLPVTVIDPQPSPSPPAAKEPITNFGTLPQFNNDASPAPGQQRECKAPTGAWTGTGLTWTLQWLIEGQPVGPPTVGTSSTHEFVAADEGKGFQCEATVEDGNVKAAVLSINRSVLKAGGVVPGHPFYTSAPTTQSPAMVANDTSGPVTIELQLPGGLQTYAYSSMESTGGLGWSCEKVPASVTQNAKVLCTRSDSLKAQASYPDLTVVTALGADAPDLAVARATVAGGGAAPVSAVDEFTFVNTPFGLTTFKSGVFDPLGNDYTQAGGHPFKGMAEFEFATKRTVLKTTSAGRVPVEEVKQVFTDLPRGFVGNALAVPKLCPSTLSLQDCPKESMIGSIFIELPAVSLNAPLYSIEPEFGTPAQFAFNDPFGNTYTVSTRLRADEGYAISFDLAPSPRVELLRSVATICSVGGIRQPPPSREFEKCKEKTAPDANPMPLFTNPTRCQGPPPTVKVAVNSWEKPTHFSKSQWTTPQITGCEEVDFEPQMQLDPTTKRADSPTGLDVNLTMPTEGVNTQDGISQANLKRTKIYFPEGMAINASAGHGLGGCSADQVKLKTNLPISCPDSSKIGTIEIDTPILKETLKGGTYIARQSDAPAGNLIGLYLVFESKKDGIIIKIPGGVKPDPNTGQLVATFDELVEDPFSSVRMHFPGGPRATLLTPPRCGKYEIKAELSPWNAKDPDNPTAAETVTDTTSFEVTEGPNGGSCPSGALEPKLNAGTEDPTAGKTSPFHFSLSRDDGTQRFSALDLATPKGLTAYLKGVPYCPDSVLSSISGAVETGQAQIENPSCPPASQIGTASAGAGGGPSPLYVNTGKAYLAGPYKGAPLSIVVVAPAVAGPLDLGTVVVRNAVHLDPETAQVSVISDPVPTILHGILLDLRDIRVSINRPNFTLNPTSCSEFSVGAQVRGELGATANVSNRFQVGGCENLEFKPRLKTQLFGPTKRGGHPSLKGVLTAGPGEANIGRASVTIPRSEFLDQSHIRTICTRVQFAAKQCPPGSVYGHASAITPLLDYPVSGPVYLRSSNNKLPDLAVALRGPDYQPIEAVVVGRVDSIKGQIRTTFESTPDVPLTKFTLQMQGGKKGLLVNSRDICSRTFRATVKMEGHNGMTSTSRPAMKNAKCGKERRGKAKRGGRGDRGQAER